MLVSNCWFGAIESRVYTSTFKKTWAQTAGAWNKPGYPLQYNTEEHFLHKKCINGKLTVLFCNGSYSLTKVEQVKLSTLSSFSDYSSIWKRKPCDYVHRPSALMKFIESLMQENVCTGCFSFQGRLMFKALCVAGSTSQTFVSIAE